MRVLGIDCGTERTGYGVIDSDGVRHSLVAADCIRTSTKDTLSRRLFQITAALRQVIATYRPECGAVEQVFHSVNARTALKLAHVRGLALLAIEEAGLPVGEYSPLEIKVTVVGYGRAEKQQVQMMVRSLLKLDSIIESEDASDAVAVAICHATHAAAQRRIGVAH
jgi:crossover junction endodeoxyribonuclease RuvC